MNRAFKQWGKEGGKKRSQTLSPAQRSLIASKAARVRWGNAEPPPAQSVRLEKIRWEDPVYLEEILAEGDLNTWRFLYQCVAEHPFGETADALEKTVRSVEIYGATRLWQSLLKNLRGGDNEQR